VSEFLKIIAASAPRVTLTGGTISDSELLIAAYAGVRVDSDGNVYAVAVPSTAQISTATDWIRPAALASGSYEARATVNSGALSGGTTGSWLALSSDREWYCEQLITGTKTANITIEIRISGSVLTSGVYDLTATTII
jgi:hypothetical protein